MRSVFAYAFFLTTLQVLAQAEVPGPTESSTQQSIKARQTAPRLPNRPLPYLGLPVPGYVPERFPLPELVAVSALPGTRFGWQLSVARDGTFYFELWPESDGAPDLYVSRFASGAYLYDGDGIDDPAVYDPATGEWDIPGILTVNHGGTGDTPLVPGG